ncbi:hypothetical protein TTHERM_00123620 (macronuclear) [Tetrahymena thermophila SB210]|uniref:Uncharacterized protein n=1 Tax=Tetrahymena thermophila (strain SB210) TaxID=312017 RepID=Q22YQ7_TETTS|nr:hypothetical protein TTHERM_00123620 [Tetrahymena thermophila SB210]EAR90614.1 hypothetical protein TTHERM_00123620 [Tetrahymena thermophila SB210]|eukprot:XP_001010859.1 hypothetical protein TTHERM_00123620 [Tetrahymena thermophila SB210]
MEQALQSVMDLYIKTSLVKKCVQKEHSIMQIKKDVKNTTLFVQNALLQILEKFIDSDNTKLEEIQCVTKCSSGSYPNPQETMSCLSCHQNSKTCI